jgi:Rod binding domain-containing protein
MATISAVGSPVIPNLNPQRTAGTQAVAKANVPTEAQLKKRQEAEKTAQEFETLFVDMMVKSMRKSAQPEDVSNAEDIYQGMLDSEYSKSMTGANNFGIREKILDWMEQTDPTLKIGPKPADTASKTNSAAKPEMSADSLKIQNEMWALKAASQAYQLNGGPR